MKSVNNIGSVDYLHLQYIFLIINLKFTNWGSHEKDKSELYYKKGMYDYNISNVINA